MSKFTFSKNSFSNMKQLVGADALLNLAVVATSLSSNCRPCYNNNANVNSSTSDTVGSLKIEKQEFSDTVNIDVSMQSNDNAIFNSSDIKFESAKEDK